MKSIFSELLEARSNSREDYLTVCFAGLLRLWKEKDSPGFLDFITWFCGKPPQGAPPEIVPQRKAGAFGKPDLWIIYEDILILMENKWDALPDPAQIKSYSDFLSQFRNDYPSIRTSLVFVNPLPHSTAWIKEPDRDLTWIEISREIKKRFENKLEDQGDLSFYVLEFMKMLEDHNMADKRVSWQYQEGIQALLTLITMIDSVLAELAKEGLVTRGLPNEARIDFASQWAGVYFRSVDNRNRFWFGQSFNEKYYDCLLFQTAKLETWRVPNEGFEKLASSNQYIRYFNFSEHFFFSRDALEQRQEIINFIRQTLNLFIRP